MPSTTLVLLEKNFNKVLAILHYITLCSRPSPLRTFVYCDCDSLFNSAEALYEASGDHRDILLTLKGQSDVIKVFVSSYQQFQEGKRPEPAYSQTAKTATRESRDQQEQRTIEAAEAELRAEGLDPSIIFQHRDLIKEWLDTVILAPTADEEDDEATVAEDSSSIVGADERISEAVLGLRLEQSKSLLKLLFLNATEIVMGQMTLGARTLQEMGLITRSAPAALARIEANLVAGSLRKRTKSQTMRLRWLQRS